MATEKILIVDDEPDAIENCRRILSRHRYDCVVEADPNRALAAIERERPHVLLTDLRMPGLDGIGLLKAAKRIDPQIKVVLLTAYASVQTAVISMRTVMSQSPTVDRVGKTIGQTVSAVFPV